MSEGLNFTDDEIEIEVERLRHFLDAVLEPGQLYEIRPVPFVPGGSIWATPEEIPDHVPTLMGWNRLKSNPYFSLNIRQFRGATKGIDSSAGSLIRVNRRAAPCASIASRMASARSGQAR
jgi:hypothetical protein